MPKKNQTKEFMIFMLPLLVWMGVIFFFSSLTGPAERHWSWKMFIERKGAHVGEFAILAWLVWRVAYQNSRKNIRRSLIGAFLFSLVYAVSDEVHQLFVFGREGRIQDVGFDMIGVCGVLFFIRILIQKKLIK